MGNLRTVAFPVGPGDCPRTAQLNSRSPLLVTSLVLFIAAATSLSQPAVAQETERDSWYTKKTEWHGFDQFHFQIATRNAYLVVPDRPLAGKPWIWRARFPSYHAEMDVDLVGRGYHVAYLDVAEMFGSPTAVAKGDEFYRYLVERRGLHPKPVLEAVSRGGLFAYNWAAKNLDHVACIYCDTPVLDFRSWPGGQGQGLGSETAWKQCLAAYGLSDADAKAYADQPIGLAAAIAKAKVPILHIVSENDQVVPPTENTYRLRDALRSHGHDMQIISVAEGTEKSHGHHFDHPDPQRVIDFVVEHTR